MSIFKISTGFIVWNVLSFLSLLFVFGLIILVIISAIMKPKLERSKSELRPSFEVYMADFYLEKLFKYFIATLFSNHFSKLQFQIITVIAIFIGLICAVMYI